MIASTGPQLAAALVRTGADLVRAGAPTGAQLAAALVRTGADLVRSGALATRLEVVLPHQGGTV